MLAILNFLNAHNLPIFQPILMILVSKIMVHRALSDKTYLSLGLLSPLTSKVMTNLCGYIMFQSMTLTSASWLRLFLSELVYTLDSYKLSTMNQCLLLPET